MDLPRVAQHLADAGTGVFAVDNGDLSVDQRRLAVLPPATGALTRGNRRL